MSIMNKEDWLIRTNIWNQGSLEIFSKTSVSIQPFFVAAYAVSGYSDPSDSTHSFHMIFPLNTINGGSLFPEALQAINTVVFSRPGPLVVFVDGAPIFPTTLLFEGSEEKLDSSKFQIWLGLSFNPKSSEHLKKDENFLCLLDMLSRLHLWWIHLKRDLKVNQYFVSSELFYQQKNFQQLSMGEASRSDSDCTYCSPAE